MIRDYQDGDYDVYIKSLTKKNMKKYFMDNFGGWSDEVSRDRFFKVITNGYVKLFFLKDVFVGYVSFNVEKYDPSSYLINDIHIVSEFQGQGYGTEILNYVKLTCKDSKQLKVFVFKENPALKFYIKNGFKEIKFIEKSNTAVMVFELN